MPGVTIVIHERKGFWLRRLRPRFDEVPITWVESRSAADLAAVLKRFAGPIVVVDLADRAVEALEEMAVGLRSNRDALTLVLDPRNHPDVAILARELGATLTLGGPVVLPEVVDVISRWVVLARRLQERAGWVDDHRPEPDPWDQTELFVERVVSEFG
jgi:hypothetical protein